MVERGQLRGPVFVLFGLWCFCTEQTSPGLELMSFDGGTCISYRAATIISIIEQCVDRFSLITLLVI